MAQSSRRCYCSVPFCSNNKQKFPYLSFHDFPVDGEIRARWVRAIRRDEGPSFKILRGSTFVCSQHFPPEDRYTSASGRIRIKQGSVPSRFHWNDWGGGSQARESVYQRARKRLGVAVLDDSDHEMPDSTEGALPAVTNDHDYACRPSPDEFVHTKEDGKGEKTGVGLQSQEPAGQSQWKLLKVVTMEKDGLKVLRIKKEINDDTEHDTPSPMTYEQPCPKVDMVFDKEWSQSLWRDDRIDSKDKTEEKETPGSSMTQHQNGGLLQCSKLNPSSPILKVFCDPERDTYPDYRLKRESLNYLFSLALTGQDRQTATFKILVFIYWLAHGTSYKTVSETFGIPLSNATSIVRDVADKLVKLSLKIVNKPSSGELALTVEGFGKLAHHPVFEKAVGAIGGCHVRVKIPGAPQPQQCPGDQPLPTINFQGVCDHTGSFIDVFAGLPGSMTDVRVLRHSPLYKCALYPPPGCFLLGNGGYPCLQTPVCLITPYSKSDQNPAHVQFNQHHAMALSSIERTFGIMKKRWHTIFLQPLELHPSFIPKVLAVCTVLHNICLRSGDVLEPVKIEDGSKVTEVLKEWLASNETSGEALRDSLAKQISTMKCMATVKDERGTSAPANMTAVQKEHAYNIVVMEH